MEGNVYFVQAGPDGPVKIGWAAGSPQFRIKSLQTGNHVPLELRATIPGGLTDEAAWHYAFRHLRVQGEWFRYDPALREAIAGGKHPKLPADAPRPPSQPRETQLQLRVSHSEKAQIVLNAKTAEMTVSDYVRSNALGLSNGDVGFGDSQAKAERIGATVPSGVPVAEPRPYDDPALQQEVQRGFMDAAHSKLVKQLEAQGKGPTAATQIAKRRLELQDYYQRTAR